jgi:hypothetical protein
MPKAAVVRALTMLAAALVPLAPAWSQTEGKALARLKVRLQEGPALI